MVTMMVYVKQFKLQNG